MLTKEALDDFLNFDFCDDDYANIDEKRLIEQMKLIISKI
jgi:hypothetical protein